MAFITALVVTTALLTPVYLLAGWTPKLAQNRLSTTFNVRNRL